jgi:hypothetical protein
MEYVRRGAADRAGDVRAEPVRVPPGLFTGAPVQDR